MQRYNTYSNQYTRWSYRAWRHNAICCWRDPPIKYVLLGDVLSSNEAIYLPMPANDQVNLMATETHSSLHNAQSRKDINGHTFFHITGTIWYLLNLHDHKDWNQIGHHGTITTRKSIYTSAHDLQHISTAIHTLLVLPTIDEVITCNKKDATPKNAKVSSTVYRPTPKGMEPKHRIPRRTSRLWSQWWAVVPHAAKEISILSPSRTR